MHTYNRSAKSDVAAVAGFATCTLILRAATSAYSVPGGKFRSESSAEAVLLYARCTQFLSVEARELLRPSEVAEILPSVLLVADTP